MAKPIRIAVIGCGLIARRAHLPAFVACEDADLVAVSSGHVETARAAAVEFGARTVYATWEEVVADPEVDAVSVCTPNALHAPITIAAARAGKHVLVEKPMAITLADADTMIAATRAAGVVLMVAHNLRFQPLFAALHDVIQAGTIGRIFSARGTFMHAGPDEAWGATNDWFWREDAAGGGALIDLGIHMVDIVRWCVGQPVREVTALMARVLKPTYADDNAILVARFAGDILASVQASWTARPFPDRTVTIHGEKGHVALRGGGAEPLAVYLQDGAGYRKVVPAVPDAASPGNLYAHFIRAITDGVHPLSDGQASRDSLAIVLAAYESARTGRVVQVG